MEIAKKPVYKYCIVPKCKNTTISAPDKVFFLVPRDANIRKIWCKAMRRGDVSPSTCLYTCEDHFDIEEDTENYIQYKIMALQEGQKTTLHLKKGVVPHKFQCQKNDDNELQLQPPQDEKGAKETKRKALVEEVLSKYTAKSQESHHMETGEPLQKKYCEAGPSTASSLIATADTENKNIDKAIQVKSIIHYRSKGVNANVRVKSKNIALSPFPISSKTTSTSPIKKASISGVKRKLFVDNLMDTESTTSQSSVLSTDYEPDFTSPESSWTAEDEPENEKDFKNLMRTGTLASIEREPKLFLGLPKRSYYLIKLLSDHIPLPTIDILITLKKIKLNDSFNILAVHFGYSQSTVSRIFSKSIPVIAEKMKDLVVWPTPPQIFKNLPIAFRARYSQVVSIIDCLEIQIERPTNAVNQALTWSQYKKCNTLKYLISCTPDGLVNFISEGYGGRATDVMIVKDCGYLECLPLNKAVMADRGFKDLSCLLENKKCTLVRPPSVLKSTPNTKEEVKQSKRIAALRIHVERVINRLREFHMLLPHACVDHNLIPIIDEVIVVACGIINLQDVLIKK